MLFTGYLIGTLVCYFCWIIPKNKLIEDVQAERDKYYQLLNFKDSDILQVYEQRDHFAREHAKMSNRFDEEWIKNDDLKRKLENSNGLIEHYYKKKIKIIEEELLNERKKNLYGDSPYIKKQESESIVNKRVHLYEYEDNN